MTAIFRKRSIVRFHPRKAELLTEVHRIWTIAQAIWPAFTINLIDVPVVLTNSGSDAGSMKRKGYAYNLEFNTKVMDMDWEEIMNTVPHEIAHLVDRFIYGFSSHHGPKWTNIVRQLGGSSKRTHSVDIETRKQRRFTYVATCGTEINLTTRTHNKVQHGAHRILRSTRGKISANCFIGEVGKVNAYVNIR